MISIGDLIHQYAATLEKTWEHDRSKSVGASEIGGCARRTWFSKHDAPRDPDYGDSWGARERGNRIEDFCVEAIRATLPDTARLLFAGKEQRTLSKGYLSATTDGIIISSDPEYCLNLDFKSFDPRIEISKEKPEHEFQVQVQMGLIRECTPYQPSESKVVYVNASFWDDIREPLVKFDERAYKAAHARAKDIMLATDPLEMRPEGKMAGGGECKYCAWASHCADVTVAGVPGNKAPLGDNAAAELKELRDKACAFAEAESDAADRHTYALEEIKQFLRDHDTRWHKGEGWSVSYSAVSGRATLDTKAVEAAGIDLRPYYKTGKQSDRLIVR